MASSSVNDILADIAAAGQAHGAGEAGSRESLIDLGLKLVSALEIPSEFLQRTFWAEPAKSAHIRLATDLRIFQHLRDAGPSGLTAAELASRGPSSTSPQLLERLLRHLVATRVLSISPSSSSPGGAASFLPTPLSDGLAEDRYQQSINFCYDVSRPSFNHLPSYFRDTGYAHPTSLQPVGPLQAAHGTELPFFQWLVATPPHLAEFDSFMSAYRAGKPGWWDEGFYPVGERLVSGFSSSSSEDGEGVLLVDVGGGRGHDLELLAAAHPGLPGRMILQDRDEVVASVAEPETKPFACQAHDFFTPQPVKGARAYSLHSILHDWGDEDGVRILEALKPALTKGYSRVLLNEIVLSEERPTLAATSMDMMMLAHFAVRERTEKDWREILGKAGYKVLGIYHNPGVAESLIEAELA